MKYFPACLLSALLVCFFLSACAVKTTPSADDRPLRAGPAYVQWLEEQACLRKAPKLTAIVSGSSISWRYGSQTSLLPEDARVWLRLSPTLTAWAGQNSFLNALADKNMAETLRALGIHGLFLSGCSDTGDEWAGASPISSLGEDGTSLSFGRTTGKKEEHARLLETLSRANVLAGGTLLPAHTGMGPDFFLALRAVRDYPGLYAMTEVPQECWPLLPSLKEDGVAALSSDEAAALLVRGVLPSPLVQDAPRFSPVPRGWAATGPVAGVDGVKRRWLYRWYEKPDRPVLHWDDPSGTARRILEASLIQNIGLRHEVLVGLHAAAWLGLEPISSSGPSSADHEFEPGLSALHELARSAHRYGAALLLMDDQPVERLALLQRAGADFSFDSVLSPALERSLLEGNAEAVQKSLRRSLRLGVSHAALWRGTADGLPRPSLATLLPLIPEGWQKLVLLPGESPSDMRINAPTLAAMACGLAPGARPKTEKLAAIRSAHMLQLATRAFLPGLLMLSGADLDGSLPEGKDWPATPPLWQLSSRPSGRHGLPSGLAMYRMPGNGVEELLERMLASRANCRIATGELIDVPSCGEKSVLITVSRLPDGASLAFFGNFSGGSVTFTPRFSLWMNASSRIDVLSENALPSGAMTLPEWGWKAVLLR